MRSEHRIQHRCAPTVKGAVRLGQGERLRQAPPPDRTGHQPAIAFN